MMVWYVNALSVAPRVATLLLLLVQLGFGLALLVEGAEYSHPWSILGGFQGGLICFRRTLVWRRLHYELAHS
jgi:hypothetical protein